MPDERLTMVDLCRGFRVASTKQLRTPLDVIIPVGLSQVGCQPAIAHHRATNGAILSRIDHATGTYRTALLTVADESVFSPDVTPTVAGLPRVVMSGSDTLPYPAGPLGYEVIFNLEGLPQFRDLAELSPTDVGVFINADGRSQSVVGGGVWRDLLLGGAARFSGGVVFLPFHTYEYGVIYVVCPDGEPTIVRYDGNIAEYVWPNVSLGEGRSTTRKVVPSQPFTLPEYNVSVNLWEATPAFASFMAGETLEPGSLVLPNQFNGPSFGRKFVFHPFLETTMPGYGGAYTNSHGITGARVNLIIWANADMESVEINGDSGTLLTFDADFDARISGLFGQAHDLYTYVKAFQYSIDPLETVFAVKFTAFGGEVFDVTTSPFTFSVLDDIPRWYEGVALAFIQTT